MSINELIWRREQVADASQKGQRVTITEEDAYFLPDEITRIEVISGRAWISYNGQDMVLGQGGRMTFPQPRPNVIITALELRPVTVKLQRQ